MDVLLPCNELYRKRPEWASGSISWHDARYLYGRVLDRAPQLVVEIGTASGVSTAVITRALMDARPAGDFQVLSYDISERFYADRSKPVGAATREMLEPGALENIEFRKGTTRDLGTFHSPDALEMVFIDADHRHPWPVLDLLAVLDFVRPGAEVLMHDINLPHTTSASTDAGAKIAFDGLELEKMRDEDGDPPNIGSIVIPDDKPQLRDQLLRLIDEHSWETDVAPETVAALTGRDGD